VTAWPHERPVLALVTDRGRLPSSDLPTLLERIHLAVDAGIRVVQIRERDLSDRALVDLVRQAVDVTRASNALVLVNDRFDIALAGGATGVHLRSDSVPASRIRRDVPQGFVIGRAVHSTAEARAVADEGACDYLMFGTVYRSAGKPADHAVAGEAALADVCAAVAVPVLAIGGIDAANAPAIARAGAAGIAAVGAFMTGDRSELRARVEKMHEAFDS
jgi:thiamine-phosphate pyrophosphorylase